MGMRCWPLELATTNKESWASDGDVAWAQKMDSIFKKSPFTVVRGTAPCAGLQDGKLLPGRHRQICYSASHTPQLFLLWPFFEQMAQHRPKACVSGWRLPCLKLRPARGLGQG